MSAMRNDAAIIALSAKGGALARRLQQILGAGEVLGLAARVSDVTAFFWLGRLIETNRTDRIFTAPAEKLTEDYVTGRFG